jgi:protein disulfide-isomerase
MRKILLSILVCFCALWLRAAEAVWLTDLPAAQAKAKKENKLVLLDFTGSDWCAPCIALKKRVLTSKEFNAYAKENLVLVEVDFPRRKKQAADQQRVNEELSKKYNIESFPTLVVLDVDGKELARAEGYDSKETPKEFIAKLPRPRKP